MMRTLRIPLAWLLFVAMWLVLNESFSLGQVAIGALVAQVAVDRLRALEVPRVRLRSLRAAAVLAGVVLADIVRSNVAVAAIVLRPGPLRHAPDFVDIPLELRDRAGLAVLGCIITATPGTTWAGYDDVAGMLTLHVLDLDDAEAMRATIKGRYERRLREIFE
jgi:multicomponent K+:H+ antiporter subunit E